jgi:hypothetical protein
MPETKTLKMKSLNWEIKLKEKERKAWSIKPPSENSKESWKKRPDNSIIKETEWDNKRMMKSDNFKIWLKTKEEKAWWMKRKSDNSKPSWNPKSDKPTNSTTDWTNSQEKAKKTTNKSDSSDKKLKRKEENQPLTKIPSRSLSTF